MHLTFILLAMSFGVPRSAFGMMVADGGFEDADS